MEQEERSTPGEVHWGSGQGQNQRGQRKEAAAHRNDGGKSQPQKTASSGTWKRDGGKVSRGKCAT
eukprot:13772198-Heterocapsa_arctica.AAC.1